jgi:heptosyltransferase-2
MSLPALAAAAENGRVSVITRPHLAEIYQLFPQKFTIHSIDTRSSIFSLFRQTAPLRQLAADNIIVLPDSFRAAAVARTCGKNTIGFAGQWRNFLLQRHLDRPADYKQLHESDLHFMLIHAAKAATVKMPLPEPVFAQTACDSLAKKLPQCETGQYFVLAPGAAFGSAKRWPPEKFAQLANLLHQYFKLPLVFTGSSNERSLVEEIIHGTHGRTFNLAGQTSLTELALLLKNAKGLAANDSGTMHLAALFQTPTVVPVGPTDMTRTGPLNQKSAIVISSACSRAPCRLRSCPLPEHVCMQAISAEETFARFMQVLNQ